MEIINHKTYADLHDASLLNDKCIFKSDTCHSFRTFDNKGNTLEFHTYPVKPFDKLLTSNQKICIDLFNEKDKSNNLIHRYIDNLLDLQSDLRELLFCRPFDIEAIESKSILLCDAIVYASENRLTK